MEQRSDLKLRTGFYCPGLSNIAVYRQCLSSRVPRRGKLHRTSAQPGLSDFCSCSRRQSLSLLSAAAVLSSLPRKVLALDGEGKSLLEQKTSEFTLPNGLHFIVLERHTAPIVSCHTFANVGAFEEEDGQTGLAHMLEHEAFKGSRRIGTTSWKKEKPLLEAQDEVFYELREERRQGRQARAEQLAGQLLELQREAGQYSVPNEFGARLTQAGAVGLNASTSHDSTRYIASLPSNVLELWFALESERFQDPVFRELYSEKRVVLEERRARVDNSPLGKFQEEFNRRAFANAYGRPVIGFQDDIEAFGRREVDAFFRRYYGPQNLTVAIVGDVMPDQVFKLATKYFGGWLPATKAVRAEAAAAPAKPSAGESTFKQGARGGPLVMKAFYRPVVGSPDALLLEVIGEILVGSRTSRLEKSLVASGRAFSTNFLPAFPGDKYPCASMLYAIPGKEASLKQTDLELMQQLSALASNGITGKELTRIKKAAKLEVVEAIRFNTGMAASLCSYHALTGSWKTVLQDLAVVDELTSERVREAAERIFHPQNCFTGYVLPEGPMQELPKLPAWGGI